jgi:hypothetical protein
MNSLMTFPGKLGVLKKDLDYQLLRASMVVIFLYFGYQKWPEGDKHDFYTERISSTVRRHVQKVLLICFTPRLSRRRRRSRNVPPSMYPTFAAISSTLALLVFKRCTACSTRRLWKYDIGVFPRTLCSLRVSVLLLAPTAFAALSRENPRASLARAQRSKSCTTGSECIR